MPEVVICKKENGRWWSTNLANFGRRGAAQLPKFCRGTWIDRASSRPQSRPQLDPCSALQRPLAPFASTSSCPAPYLPELPARPGDFCRRLRGPSTCKLWIACRHRRPRNTSKVSLVSPSANKDNNRAPLQVNNPKNLFVAFLCSTLLLPSETPSETHSRSKLSKIYSKTTNSNPTRSHHLPFFCLASNASTFAMAPQLRPRKVPRPKKLSCHYCVDRPKDFTFDGTIKQFDCSICKATNFFDAVSWFATRRHASPRRIW